MKNYFSAKMIAFLALFSALILLATAFLQIPNPLAGYTNLGDGFIFLGAAFFGAPFALISGAVGSALADLMLGYAAYSPFTFIIKGVEGLLAALAMRGMAKLSINRHIALISGCLFAAVWMIFGYFVADTVLYGMAAGLGGIANNCVQGVIGVVLGYLLSLALCRVKGGVLENNISAKNKGKDESDENNNDQ